MAVMAREAWTDERLDDLNHRVDDGFREMRAEFRALRGEMAEFRRETQAEFAAQRRAMLQLFAGMYATTVFGFLGVIAALVTQG
jgi:ATP/maltotriose-dependent transcriptional regulator MalT